MDGVGFSLRQAKRSTFVMRGRPYPTAPPSRLNVTLAKFRDTPLASFIVNRRLAGNRAESAVADKRIGVVDR